MCGFFVPLCFVYVGTWERVASHSHLNIPRMPRATFFFGVNQFLFFGSSDGKIFRRQNQRQGQGSQKSVIKHRRQWQRGLQSKSDGGSCGMWFYYNAQCTSYFAQCPNIFDRFSARFCQLFVLADFLLRPKNILRLDVSMQKASQQRFSYANLNIDREMFCCLICRSFCASSAGEFRVLGLM